MRVSAGRRTHRRMDRPPQLAKRKAEELEDFGTADASAASKHAKADVEVRGRRGPSADVARREVQGHLTTVGDGSARGALGRAGTSQAGDRAMSAFLDGVRDLPVADMTDAQALEALEGLRATLAASANAYVHDVLATL